MLKIGIIGSGFGRYGLLPAFSTTPGCKVVALAGKKTDVLVADCKKFGLETIYEDWRELLKREDLDAVAVAVAPRAQYAIVKSAIEQGLHVFAEKPLALNVREAKDLLRRAKSEKIVHSMDFIFPEIAAWKEVKKIIDTKRYGNLLHIDVHWEFQSYDIKNKKKGWKTTASEGGGALSFYFSHGLHYLENFAGTINDVKSVFTYNKASLGGAEVAADMILRFQSGATGIARVCCNSVGVHRHQLVFQCERGTLTLENQGGHVRNFTIKAQTENGEETVAVLPEESHRDDNTARIEVVKKLTSRFVKSCTRKSGMRPSFEEGVRVQELIAKVRKSKI